MIRLSFVAAASENNVIGNKNALPWSLPNDLKFFKNTTWGMPVIMGRKTFDSFKKMLPGRVIIVITRNPEFKAEGVAVVSDLDAAIKKAAEADVKEAFIIGGGEIFQQGMAIVDRIYLTRVHATFEGDAFFPVIDPDVWGLSSNRDFETDEKHAFRYSFQVWERIGQES